MCGIVGIAGTRDVAQPIVEALKRLEYRGYDSAGIATLVDGHIDRRRMPGKLARLETAAGTTGRCPASPASGIRAGPPTARRPNATPTRTRNARVALVHNGIIENFRELREELRAAGHQFESETDSEVPVHLVTHYLEQGMSPKDAAIARGAAADRRLCARHDLRRRRVALDRLPQGRAAGGRLRQGRRLSGLRRVCARAVHRSRGVSGRRRRRRHQGRRRSPSSTPTARLAAREIQLVPPRAGHGRQGRPAPFHGQGNPRTARSLRPHRHALSRRVGPAREPARRERD